MRVLTPKHLNEIAAHDVKFVHNRAKEIMDLHPYDNKKWNSKTKKWNKLGENEVPTNATGDAVDNYDPLLFNGNSGTYVPKKQKKQYMKWKELVGVFRRKRLTK